MPCRADGCILSLYCTFDSKLGQAIQGMKFDVFALVSIARHIAVELCDLRIGCQVHGQLGHLENVRLLRAAQVSPCLYGHTAPG